MTEEEISQVISQFLVSNWKTVLTYSLSLISGSVLSTWFIARHWYLRDIKHLKQTIKYRTDLENEKTKIFDSRIEERNSYAQGIMQLADQRVQALEEEKNRLEEHVDNANKKLAEYKQKNLVVKYEEEDIDQLITFSNRIELFIQTLHETDPKSAHINFNFKARDIKLNSKSDYMIYIHFYNEVFESLSEELLKSKISESKMELYTYKCQKSYYKGLADIVLPLTKDADLNISKEEYIEKIESKLIRNLKKPEDDS